MTYYWTDGKLCQSETGRIVAEVSETPRGWGFEGNGEYYRTIDRYRRYVSEAAAKGAAIQAAVSFDQPAPSFWQKVVQKVFNL